MRSAGCLLLSHWRACETPNSAECLRESVQLQGVRDHCLHEIPYTVSEIV